MTDSDGPKAQAPAPAVYMQPTYLVATAPPRGLSIASMVLGLISLVLGFTFICPVVGLILGFVGLRREPAGRGMAIAGIILNGLMILCWVAFTVFLIVVIGIGVTGAGLGTILNNN